MHNNSNCTSLTTPHTIVHHQHLKNQKEQRYKQHKMHNLNHIIHNISSSPISSKPTKKKRFSFSYWADDKVTNNSTSDEKEIERFREGDGMEEEGKSTFFLWPWYSRLWRFLKGMVGVSSMAAPLRAWDCFPKPNSRVPTKS